MFRKVYIYYLFLILLFSCARVGMPEGGEKDRTPPKVLACFPQDMSINVDPNIKKITIYLDKYILLKDPYKEIVISPTLRTTPQIDPVGLARKEIIIKFTSPLEKDKTYNINFGSSIDDYNEGNPLNNYVYTFSTGKSIDKYELKGSIDTLAKANLSELVVGLYKYYKNDSINLLSKPYYISKVDSTLKFNFSRLSAGKYRLVAFEDKSESSIIDNKTEVLGFFKKI